MVYYKVRTAAASTDNQKHGNGLTDREEYNMDVSNKICMFSSISVLNSSLPRRLRVLNRLILLDLLGKRFSVL